MSSLPFVSIVVPIYNASRTIRRCVEAIQALKYPKDRWETIFVDNGSTDGTCEILDELGARWVLETYPTSYAARNRGVADAKGDILAFTDSDCFVHPHWLDWSVHEMTRLNCQLLGGLIEGVHDASGIQRHIGLMQSLNNARAVLGKKFAAGANLVVTREAFDSIKGFRGELFSGGDMDFCWRALEQGFQIAYSDMPVVYHHHRTDLLDFYTQYFKYGFALPHLQTLHPTRGIFSGGVWRRTFNQNSILFNLVTVGNQALYFILLGPFMGRKTWIKLLLKWVHGISFATGNILGHIDHMYQIERNLTKSRLSDFDNLNDSISGNLRKYLMFLKYYFTTSIDKSSRNKGYRLVSELTDVLSNIVKYNKHVNKKLEEVGPVYFNIYGKEKGLLDLKYNGLHHYEMASLISEFKKIDSGSVLIVGCNIGFLGIIIKKRWPKLEVFGFDNRPVLIEMANVFLELFKVNVNYSFIDDMCVDGVYEQGQFDVIYICELLENIQSKKEQEMLLLQSIKVCKPGGKIIISGFYEYSNTGTVNKKLIDPIWLETFIKPFAKDIIRLDIDRKEYLREKHFILAFSPDNV